jgi:hypothetical protein
MAKNTPTKSTKAGRRGDKAAAKQEGQDQRTEGVRDLGDSQTASKIRFSAKIFRPAATAIPRSPKAVSDGWTFLTLPKEASAKLPSRGMVSVEGTFNGSPFRATLEPDGQGGHWLKVDRKMREAAGAEAGEVVTIEIAPVGEEPEPTVPADLRKALAAAPKGAREVWSDITPVARRDWIQWITSGKRAETRAIRIDKACDMLAKGKRRPCCFDRSGMYDKSLSCPAPDIADDESSETRR